MKSYKGKIITGRAVETEDFIQAGIIAQDTTEPRDKVIRRQTNEQAIKEQDSDSI